MLLALAVWRYWDSPAAQSLLRPQALRHRFDFDNGSLRLPRLDAPNTTATDAPARSASAVRKCMKGKQILYTEFDCPPGTSEQALGAGSVTFVAPQDIAAAKAATKTPAARAKGGPADGSDRP